MTAAEQEDGGAHSTGVSELRYLHTENQTCEPTLSPSYPTQTLNATTAACSVKFKEL